VLIWVKMGYELNSNRGYESLRSDYSCVGGDFYKNVGGFKGEYDGEIKDYCD
jgi:hypothetical protein